MGLNLASRVAERLRSYPDNRLTARELAVWIFRTYPEDCAAKLAKSDRLESEDELLQQIVAEIGSQRLALQKRYPQIRTDEGRPRRYYWSELSEKVQAQLSNVEQVDVGGSGRRERYSEADLYPLVSEFVWSELGLYSKRIDDKRGSNSGGSGANRWLYPDIVGMEDLTSEWHLEIRQIVKEYADKKARLYSFEVKRLVNRSNVRECYFQTVSNSSWANFGYLVTANIEGNEAMKELRMLFGLHGLGLMKLDIDSPTESEILIPARERTEVDWATCNRLAKENADFLGYLELVRQFHQTGDPRPKDWDFAPEV